MYALIHMQSLMHMYARMHKSEYATDGYKYVVSHQKNTARGGVIIYIREDISYDFLTAASDDM